MPPSYQELKNRDMRAGDQRKSEPLPAYVSAEAKLDDVIHGMKALNAALRDLAK